ncbi:hypothetical protein B4113_0357 [Geobacillus sp. B4113_201601]|nr:hypothetical protein B4113_0357 [Geobacillus sp. B4113_201601]
MGETLTGGAPAAFRQPFIRLVWAKTKKKHGQRMKPTASRFMFVSIKNTATW